MAYDMYLKLDGIAGEEADGSIHLKSFDAKVSITPAAPPTPRGAPIYGFSIRKEVDAASPVLFQATGNGQVFPTGSLTVQAGTPPVVLSRFLLTRGFISATSTDGNIYGDEAPIESLSFAFQKIVWTVTG